MTWLKVDDQFYRHPKVQALTDAAFRLHVFGLCFSAQYLTDGFVADPVLRSERPKSAPLTAELVRAQLWHREAGGYRIHDYLKYNPSREHVEAERTADRERKKAAGIASGKARGGGGLHAIS